LNDWYKIFNITLQYIIFYMSIQNDIVKKIIQITENSVCIIIKKTQLLIKFWVQTAQTDIYFYNWIIIDFLINNKQMISEKTFTDVKSFINYICVWECKYYSYYWKKKKYLYYIISSSKISTTVLSMSTS